MTIRSTRIAALAHQTTIGHASSMAVTRAWREYEDALVSVEACLGHVPQALKGAPLEMVKAAARAFAFDAICEQCLGCKPTLSNQVLIIGFSVRGRACSCANSGRKSAR